MYYPNENISVYDLREFIKKYKPKKLLLNIIQIEKIYSKLNVIPEKPLYFRDYNRDYNSNKHQLMFDNLIINML